MAGIINFVGKSNTGKTTLITKVISYICHQGYSVGVIKHDVHDFEIDHKEKDTYKHKEAGASTVIISNRKKYALIKDVEEEASLENLIELCQDKDLIIIEGYKKSPYDKIELLREERYKEPISDRRYLKAIACDFDISIDDENIEIFDIDDFESVGNFIINNYILQ